MHIWGEHQQFLVLQVFWAPRILHPLYYVECSTLTGLKVAMLTLRTHGRRRYPNTRSPATSPLAKDPKKSRRRLLRFRPLPQAVTAADGSAGQVQ